MAPTGFFFTLRAMLIFLLALLLAGGRAILLVRHPAPRRWTWWLGWLLVLFGVVIAAVMAVQDITVQKLLGRLVMPLGLLWLALWLLTATAFCRGLRRWGGALAIIAVGLTLAANPLFAGWLIRGLEARVPDADAATLGPVDAVFVLGGGTQCSTNAVPNLGYNGDRVLLAARLYHTGTAPLLVCSGSGIVGLDDGRDLAAETAWLWRGLGIPDNAIRQLPGPRTTSEELAAYRDFIAVNGWQRVGLITSAWHLPRALRTCERLGLTMVPIPAGRHGPPLPWSPVYLIPTGEAAYEMQTAVWEWIGMLAGR